ncbi:hypothetical protein [Leucobacter sp.]
MSRTYATEAEYADWLGEETPPAGAARLLRDASLEVDEMLITAVYRVDHDGNPIEPKVIAALRDATCAQAEHRDEHGDEVTVMEGGEAASLGPLSFGGTGARSSGAAGVPQYAPKAYRVLRLAGLIPGRVTDG